MNDSVLGVCEEICIDNAEASYDEERQSRQEITGGPICKRLKHWWIDEQNGYGEERCEPSQCTPPPPKGHKNEERENAWKITRNERINSRITHFINNAETELLFGTWSTPLLQEEIANALITAAERDVSVTVLSHDEALADQFPDLNGLKVVKPAIKGAEETSSRILAVDDDTVLLSVFDDDDPSITPGEAAIWSSETGFAQVLVQLIEVYLRPMDGSS